nr:MAG TPA: hypothetical protein [Bacteriophage sp.]
MFFLYVQSHVTKHTIPCISSIVLVLITRNVLANANIFLRQSNIQIMIMPTNIRQK